MIHEDDGAAAIVLKNLKVDLGKHTQRGKSTLWTDNQTVSLLLPILCW